MPRPEQSENVLHERSAEAAKKKAEAEADKKAAAIAAANYSYYNGMTEMIQAQLDAEKRKELGYYNGMTEHYEKEAAHNEALAVGALMDIEDEMIYLKKHNAEMQKKHEEELESKKTSWTPSSSVTASSGDFYIVKSGDTLWSIARAHGLTLEEILALNPQITNKNVIHVGNKINIKPSTDGDKNVNLNNGTTDDITGEPIVEWNDTTAELLSNSIDPNVKLLAPSPRKRVAFRAESLGRFKNVQFSDDRDYNELYRVLPNLNEANDQGLTYPTNGSAEAVYNLNDLFDKYQHYGTRTDFSYTGFQYMFITKPKINLGDVGKTGQENTASDSFFTYLQLYKPEVLEVLNSRNTNNSGIFIRMLTNRYKGFDTQDVVMRTKETYETWKGYKITQPVNIIDSINGGTFSISYDETEDAMITLIHKCWVDYIDKIRNGNLRPDPDIVEFKEIDYMSSLYFFTTEPDGRTLKYWAKYTGVMPISVPYSAFGGEKGAQSVIRNQVQYAYSYKEDLEPDVLKDFNRIVMSDDSTEIRDMGQVYDNTYSQTGNIGDMTSKFEVPLEGIGSESGMGSSPFIVPEFNDGKLRYKLIFI